jgi:Asp-tRNA(Asn)/Glu-tRNA(Gln) amidotransferase A subunit family amidase
VDDMFGGADLWVTPTVAVPAPRIGLWKDLPSQRAFEKAALLGVFTAPFNITGQPAASIPAGFTRAGMPIGVQLVGRRMQDGLVLAVSRQLEQQLNFHLRPPAYTEST